MRLPTRVSGPGGERRCGVRRRALRWLGSQAFLTWGLGGLLLVAALGPVAAADVKADATPLPKQVPPAATGALPAADPFGGWARVAAAIQAADRGNRFGPAGGDEAARAELLAGLQRQIAAVRQPADAAPAAALEALLRHARGPTGPLCHYSFPPEEAMALPAGPTWNLERVADPHLDRLWLRVFGAAWHPAIGGGDAVPLKDNGLKLTEPGLYLLSADDGERRAATWLCRDDLCLTVLGDDQAILVLVSTPAGAPVPHAEVYALADLGLGTASQPEHALAAVTGADGVALLPVNPPAGAQNVNVRLAVRAGERLAFAAEEVRLPWNSTRWQVHLAAERPLYAPGETVKLRGIVRTWRDGVSEPHTGKKLLLVIEPSPPNPAWSRQFQVVTDAFGAFAVECQLPADAPLGLWRCGWDGPFEGELPPASYVLWRASENACDAFRIEEFRTPSLVTSLEASRRAWRPGETIELTATVRALSGEPLAAAGWLGPAGSALRLPVRTGPDGSARLRLAEALLPANTQSLTLEIPDPAGGAIQISCPLELVRSDATRRLALAPLREWSTPAEGVAVAVTLTDLQGLPVRGRVRVQARLAGVPPLEQTIAVEGRATARFAAPAPGDWTLVAHSDGAAEATTTVTVAGRGSRHLNLRPDRAEYRVGDIAEVAVAGPAGPVLVLVDAGGYVERHALDLSQGPALLRLPVLAEHAPGFRLLAVAVHEGQVEEADAVLPLAAPEIPLRIELAVPATAKPGQEVSVGLRVRDDAGHPIPGRVALAVVDDALYRLQDEYAPPLADAFRPPSRDPRLRLCERTAQVIKLRRYLSDEDRGSAKAHAVRWEDWVLAPWLDKDAAGRVRVADRSDGLPPHDGVPGDPMFGMRAPGYPAADKLPAASVRRDLRHDAYWNPAIDTDERGEATVTLRLPENLSAWRVTARVATRDRRAGEARVTFTATQSLRLRLHHPRVLRPGELTTLRVHLAGDMPGTATLAWELAGLTAKGPLPTSVPLVGAASVDLPVVVGPGSTATVTVRAACGTAQDALALTLPIEPAGCAVQWYDAGPVTGQREVRLPELPRGGSGRLQLRLEPGPLAALDAALAHVREFPYGCVEQAASRFVPAALLAQALTREQWAARPAAADVAGLILAGRTRLASLRRADFTWGWWPGSAPRLWLTAYARWALAVSYEGLPHYDRDNRDRRLAVLLAEPLLLDELTGAAPPTDPNLADERAELLAQWRTLVGDGEYDLPAALLWLQAASLDGTLDPAALQPLLAQEARFAPVERLLLAQSLARTDRPAAERLARAALDQLQAAAPGGRGLTADPALAAAFALRAGAALAPDHPQVTRLLGQVLAGRRGGVWPTTLANSLSLAALAAWLQRHPEAPAPVPWQVTVAGQALPLPAATANATLVERDVKGGERITVVGNGWLDLGLNWRTADAPPLATELKLERRLFRRYWGELGEPRREPLAPDAPLRCGERLEVELLLTTAAPLAELCLEAPNASGLEPLLAESGVPHAPATNREVRRTHLAFFFDSLPAGTTALRWECAVELPGRPVLPPAEVWCMYRPAVRARCAATALRFEPAPPAPAPVQELSRESGERLATAVVRLLEPPGDHGDGGLAELLLALDTRAGAAWLGRGLPGLAPVDADLAKRLLDRWRQTAGDRSVAARLALPLPRAVLVDSLWVPKPERDDWAAWRRELLTMLAPLTPAEQAGVVERTAHVLGDLTPADVLARLDDVPAPLRPAFAAGLRELYAVPPESPLWRAPDEGAGVGDLAVAEQAAAPAEALFARLAGDGPLARRLLPKTIYGLGPHEKDTPAVRARLEAAAESIAKTAVAAHAGARLSSVRAGWNRVFAHMSGALLLRHAAGAPAATRRDLAGHVDYSLPAADIANWLAHEDDAATREALVTALAREGLQRDLPLARWLELRDGERDPGRRAKLLGVVVSLLPEARPALVAAVAASPEEASVAIRALDADATPAAAVAAVLPRLRDPLAAADALHQVLGQRLRVPPAHVLDALAVASPELEQDWWAENDKTERVRNLGRLLGAWLDDAGADLALARLPQTDAYGAQLAMAEALAPRAPRLEAGLRALLAQPTAARAARLALALGGKPVPAAALLEQFQQDRTIYGRELAAGAVAQLGDADAAAQLCTSRNYRYLPATRQTPLLALAGDRLPADVVARLAPDVLESSPAAAALVAQRLSPAGLAAVCAVVWQRKSESVTALVRELPPPTRAALATELMRLPDFDRVQLMPLLLTIEPQGVAAFIREARPWVATAAVRALLPQPAADDALLLRCANHPRWRQQALRQLDRERLVAEREAHTAVRREEAAAAWYTQTGEAVAYRDEFGAVRPSCPWNWWWWEPEAAATAPAPAPARQ